VVLKIAYQVLKSGTPYTDLGADFYTRRESPAQRQAWLERQLQKLHPGRTVPAPRPPAGQTSDNAQPLPPHRPGANWAARGRPVSRRRGVFITDRPDDPSAGSCRGSWNDPGAR
jgi:hypothetical protein